MKQDLCHGEIELVKAAQEDIDEVHSIWLEAANWMKSKNINQWRDDQLTRDTVKYCFDNSDMFLAKRDNRIIGTLFIVWSDPHLWEDLDHNSGYLHRLAIKREFAGNGLGFKLLAAAEQYIREQGKKYFRLDCMAENEKLNTFYGDAGFEYKGRVDGEGWSASLFEKQL